jgi:hypothetical protein
MSGGPTDILVVVLFAAFAITTIIVIFAVAGKVFHEIVEAFQRSTLAGLGMLALCVVILVGLVTVVQFATPYVASFYRSIAG